MTILIESLIGIILFTIIIVAFTLKDPLTSVGDYPPAIRDRCMELGLIEKENSGLPEGILYGRRQRCSFLCSYLLLF